LLFPPCRRLEINTRILQVEVGEPDRVEKRLRPVIRRTTVSALAEADGTAPLCGLGYRESRRVPRPERFAGHRATSPRLTW
jgi:hypothetical protein